MKLTNFFKSLLIIVLVLFCSVIWFIYFEYNKTYNITYICFNVVVTDIIANICLALYYSIKINE